MPLEYMHIDDLLAMFENAKCRVNRARIDKRKSLVALFMKADRRFNPILLSYLTIVANKNKPLVASYLEAINSKELIIAASELGICFLPIQRN